MSSDFETLFGIKESVSQEEIEDLKNYRGDKVSLFKFLNRRLELLYKDTDQLQDILYNICKYVDPNKRDSLIHVEDPLRNFNSTYILEFYNKLVEDNNEQLIPAIAFLNDETTDWFAHQLKEIYKNNSKEVADELSYDLYYLATSGNRHVTKIKDPFAFVKNKKLLDFYNKLSFNPALQTAFILIPDNEKMECLNRFLKEIDFINKNDEFQNDDVLSDAILDLFKNFHDDNKEKANFRDKISKKFYDDLSNDFSRDNFLKLSDDMRLDVAMLPVSIARNLLDNTAKNPKLFKSLLIWEDYARHKDPETSILSTLPEEYYYQFATNKQFRKDFMEDLFSKVITKEAAETTQSVDAQAKKAKDDELKKTDQDNRDALRKAADTYAQQQYPDQKNNKPVNPTKFKKLQEVDGKVNGFLNAFYKEDQEVQDYIGKLSVDSILDICKVNHNKLNTTFSMFAKLFEKGLQPATITKLPEDVQEILYKNIYNLDNVLDCAKQQEKYGIPSTGDSPNVNLFLNRFAQLYNTKEPQLAIKYADLNANDKLQLESFIRDHAKSSKLGSEIIRFLNSNENERANFEFTDTPSVSHKIIKNNEEEFDGLLKVAKETKAINGIYERYKELFKNEQNTDEQDTDIDDKSAIKQILNNLNKNEVFKFNKVLSDQFDSFRFAKCILFLISLTAECRSFVLHHCTGVGAEYLCNIASKMEGKEFVDTVNEIITKTISDNKDDAKLKFDNVDDNKDVATNVEPKQVKQTNTDDQTTTSEPTTDSNYLKSIEPKFSSDIIHLDNDSIVLFDKTFSNLAIPFDTVTITNNSELFTFVINTIIKQLKKYKIIKGKVDTSQKANIEQFKDNILNVKNTLINTQNKIDELNKVQAQIKTTEGDTSDLNEKVKELSDEIIELTQSLSNELGDESDFNYRLNRFRNSNESFFSQFKKETSFLDFSSLANEIKDQPVEKMNAIDFNEYIDSCDRFYKLADDGMLNETGLAYLAYLFKLTAIIENAYNYIDSINEKRIAKYKIDIANYKKNNSDITSFDTFKRAKDKPQMPKLIDEKSLKDKISSSLQNIENILKLYIKDVPEIKKQYVKTFEDQTDLLIDYNNNLLQNNSKDAIDTTISNLANIDITDALSQILNKYQSDTNNLFDDLLKEIKNIQSDLHEDDIFDFDDMLKSLKRNPSSNATIFNKAKTHASKVDSTAKQEIEFLNQYLKLQ